MSALAARPDLSGLAPPAPVPVPALDAASMSEIDRIATDELGIGLVQMMENAGRELAVLARSALGGSAVDRRVLVLAGTGNNAGGGMVAARRLASWGADVSVVLARPVLSLRPAPCAQLDGLTAAGARVAVAVHDRALAEIESEMGAADVVLDALIGYNLAGPPDEAYRPLIELAAASPAPVISLDIPSGLDATSGARPGAAVRADATMAVALPKAGTETAAGRSWAGTRYLADISIPPRAYAQIGLEVGPIFATSTLVALS